MTDLTKLTAGELMEGVFHLNYQAEIRRRLTELGEHEASFELRWKSDMRAIERWQKAHPGNEHTWPDHTDLSVWLMERLEQCEASSERIPDQWLEAFEVLQKRLEQCEADYKRCCELNEKLCYEVHDLKAARAALEKRKQRPIPDGQCQCTACSMARAALEEKPKLSSEIVMVNDPLYDPWLEEK